jgi:hypothetical protein
VVSPQSLGGKRKGLWSAREGSRVWVADATVAGCGLNELLSLYPSASADGDKRCQLAVHRTCTGLCPSGL